MPAWGRIYRKETLYQNAMRRYTALQSVAMARSTRGSSSQSALFRSPQTTGLKDPEKYVLDLEFVMS
jgi:hypothetical protein